MKAGRAYKYYTNVVVEDLLNIYNYNSIMEFMRFYRIILSTTSQRFLSEKRYMIDALAALIILFGQKGVYTRARKSIAGFSVRKGNIVGCMVTLRRQKMYAFMDRMIAFAFGLYEFTELTVEAVGNGSKGDKTRSNVGATARFAMLPSLPFDCIKSQLIDDNLLNTNIGSACQSRASNRSPSFFSWYTCMPNYNSRLIRIADQASSAKSGFNHNIHLKGGLKLSADAINFNTKTQATLSAMPELEHLFSFFDSIKGINTVYSLVAPNIYSSKSVNTYRQRQGDSNLKQSTLSFKCNVWLLEFTNPTNLAEQTISSRAHLAVYLLPKQKPSLLFTAFQFPKTLASAL